jgi:hypothetical protein
MDTTAGIGRTKIHMSRFSWTEPVRLNARRGNWTLLHFATDSAQSHVPGHVGTVRASAVATCNCLPTRRGTSTLQPYREESPPSHDAWRMDWFEERQKPGLLGHRT